MNDLKFIDAFKLLVRQGNYDNTYKMAWAKALVEIAYQVELNNPVIEISLESIAKKYIKYYWNQTIFFNLIQGSNISKPPVILQHTIGLIDLYKHCVNDNKPIFFERAESYIETHLNKEYEVTIRKVVKALKENVSYRFLVYESTILEQVYAYKKGDSSLFMKQEDVIALKENQQDLFDLINYRWSLILETFNSSPKINRKVRIMDEREIKRSPLKKFDDFLDIENPNHICFRCSKQIPDNELSRDHVIPWSYLYSDDLWNIVYVCKSCNSSKNNNIPDEKNIYKLKQRNVTLLDKLKMLDKKSKDVDELKMAIDKNLVDQFYIGCKG